MIATPRFVFLHLHKSGGTYVNRWLMRFIPGASQLGYHLPRSMIPAELADLPVLGLVRNPWSYYVSWYAFQSRMARPNALFRIASDDGALGFEGTVTNLLELAGGGPLLDALVSGLPRSYGQRGLNLPGPQLAKISGSGLGFYSFLYHYLYAGAGEPRLVKMEQMRTEFPKLVESCGLEVGAEARRAFESEPAANRADHRPYAEYYSPALRGLVEERDAAVIDRHAYRFDD